MALNVQNSPLFKAQSHSFSPDALIDLHLWSQAATASTNQSVSLLPLLHGVGRAELKYLSCCFSIWFMLTKAVFSQAEVRKTWCDKSEYTHEKTGPTVRMQVAFDSACHTGSVWKLVHSLFAERRAQCVLQVSGMTPSSALWFTLCFESSFAL